MKSKICKIVILVAICYFGYTFVNQQVYLEERRLQYSKLQKEYENEKIKNEQLLHQKSLISTEEFAEKIAREKLGYVKDGEKIYVDINK